MSRCQHKALVLTLLGVLTLGSLGAQEVRVQPVKPSTPLLVGAGAILASAGVVVLSGTFDLKDEADAAWITWKGDPTEYHRREKDAAGWRYGGTLATGFGLAMGGLVLTMVGINQGEGDMDYFRVSPPSRPEEPANPAPDQDPAPTAQAWRAALLPPILSGAMVADPVLHW